MAVVGALSALLVLVLAWPLPTHPGARVLGASQNDFYGIAWGLHHVAQHVLSLRWPPLWVEEIAWPGGATLLVADLPEAILMAPFTGLLGPTWAFNLLSVAHHGLAAACAFWCARHLGASRAGAAVAAAAFGFAPALIGNTFNQNPDVTAWYWIPLAAGFAASARGPGRAALAGLCAAAGAACNPYGGLMAGLAVLVLLPMRPWRPWLTALLAGGIPGALWSGLSWWSLNAANAGVHKGLRKDPFHGTATLVDFLDPTPFIMTQRQWDEAFVAHWAYLGILLFVLGMLAFWRLRAWRLALLTGVALLLALGPDLSLTRHLAVPSPYRWLEMLPGIDRLHLNHRYTTLAVLALSLALARWASSWGRRAWLLPPLLLLDVLVLGGGAKLLRSQAPFDDGSCALLEGLPEGPVIDLPATSGEFWLFAATCHGRPVAEGINTPLNRELHAALSSAPPGRRLEVLRHYGFRLLVYHDKVPRTDLRRFEDVWEEASGCVTAQNDAGVRVVDLDACAAAFDHEDNVGLRK